MLRLRELRKQHKISQQELAAYVGVTQATLSGWENEKYEIDNTGLKKIADFFNTSTDYILGRTDELLGETFSTSELILSDKYDNIIPIKTYSVPLVGTIACGTPVLAEENIEEYIKVSEEINCDFALRCKGDSMINARIFDGDIVYIRQQPTVENGDIAAVLIDDEATLKKVYMYPNRIELRAENPTFKTLEFENEEMNKIKILGKAVAFFSMVR